MLVLAGCRGDAKPKDDPTSLIPALPQIPSPAASEVAELLAQEPLGMTVTGKIHSVGGELGTFDVPLEECESGETSGFFGVDLYSKDSKDLRLRYVHDEAKGNIVKVAYNSKKGSVYVITRDDKCAVLEGSVEKTNFSTRSTKGMIRHLKGHVKFDCPVEGKGHVTGEATFAGCH